MNDTYSITGNTFTHNGKPIPGIEATQNTAGQWQYHDTGTGETIPTAGPMTPQEFAQLYFRAEHWEDTPTPALEAPDPTTAPTTDTNTTAAQTLRDTSKAIPEAAYNHAFGNLTILQMAQIMAWIDNRAYNLEHPGKTP